MSESVADLRRAAAAQPPVAPVDRARALVASIRRAAPSIERDRQLPPALLQELHAARLFRLTLPHTLGGEELQPAVLAQVTETVAAADASVAWCLGQAFGCAMSATFLEAASARQVFGPEDAVLAWGAGTAGKATACEGGYRIQGSWRFASGGKHATWIGAHCKVYEADGSRRVDANGRAVDRTALFPRSAVAIADDWYVMGLKGTRSEGYTIDDLFVPAALTLDRDSPDECRSDATLYRFSTTGVYASAFSGVALGVARGMLDDLLALALEKTPRGARSPLRDNPVFQTQIAELEACLRAARAYQQSTLREAWERAADSGQIGIADRVQIRLATTHAINQATAVVEKAYRMAGSSAIFEDGPFERRFRDAHAVSQQVQGRQSNFETVGRHLLGHDVDTLFL